MPTAQGGHEGPHPNATPKTPLKASAETSAKASAETSAKASAKATVVDLRARIRALERGWERGWQQDRHVSACERPGGACAPSPAGSGPPPGVLPLGVPAIDAHLPGGGLRLAGLHEIAGARDEWDDAVAAGFCLALLGRLSAAGSILWVARRADLYGPGLAGRLAPDRFVLVRARRDTEVLWALEEGLRAPPASPARSGGGGLSAVVGEVDAPGDTALRRLQLAAEAAGRPCFLLRRRLYAAASASMSASMSAVALTRWRVAALPSMAPSVGPAVGPAVGPPTETGLRGLPGRPRWRLDLLRCRGAAPGTFSVEWDDAAGDFPLAAPVLDRPVAQETAPGYGHRRAG